MGTDSGVYQGSFFDLGPNGEVDIGSFCALVGVIINSNGRVVIRDYALLAHEVVISDSPFGVPADYDSAEPDLEIAIGENAWIGARAVLLPGAQIGEGAIVGAAAVVDFPVPAYAIVAGNPARIVGWSKPHTEP